MVDIYSPAKRSEVMSRVRGHGNKDTELALIRLFRHFGIRGWRRNQQVFGKPDFVFPKTKVAVFVDGCFWHGCPKHCSLPRNNRPFWRSKLAANKARDQQVSRALRKAGWRVLRIWEHDLAKRPEACLRKVRAALGSGRPRPVFGFGRRDAARTRRQGCPRYLRAFAVDSGGGLR